MEWNGWSGGQLISMALVTETGAWFYAELEITEEVHPWVAENVIPRLRGVAMSYSTFQSQLKSFLEDFDTIEIIADWPEDIERFCAALKVGEGQVHTYRPITFKCNMGMYQGAVSGVPHHALYDAQANMDWQVLCEREDGKWK